MSCAPLRVGTFFEGRGVLVILKPAVACIGKSVLMSVYLYVRDFAVHVFDYFLEIGISCCVSSVHI